MYFLQIWKNNNSVCVKNSQHMQIDLLIQDAHKYAKAYEKIATPVIIEITTGWGGKIVYRIAVE